jgi:predicted Zn-dependent protease
MRGYRRERVAPAIRASAGFRQKRFFLPAALSVVLSAFLVVSCATNPATGKKTLNLVSESQEISLGRQSDKEIVNSLGVYQDSDLDRYIADLGKKLAAVAERPELPWTFRVIDDPTVNAFALPGGFIYVTRGILTYMTTEAELAGVVGHEIGHVTAMHAVQRISSQQLLQLGLGIGMAVAPELQQFGQVIGAGLGILFLKFSREDENQADSLGLRYMTRADYDPRQMIKVMEMLDRVSSSEGSGRIPEWLSTHPNPENRIHNIQAQVDRMHEDFDTMMVDRDRYLDHIDGLVYGINPREGFFRANVFYQPDLKFEFAFPEGWSTNNMKQAVSGVSPRQDAIIQITLSKESTPAAAADSFFAQSGITAAGVKKTEINRLPAVTGQFSVRTDQGVLQGMAAFVSYDGHIYQILGYSTLQGWPDYAAVVERSLYSFDRLTDTAILSVQPMRIRIVTLDQDMTLADFGERYPSPIPLKTLAIINQVDTDSVLRTGQLVKRVVGEKIP